MRCIRETSLVAATLVWFGTQGRPANCLHIHQMMCEELLRQSALVGCHDPDRPNDKPARR
jgi:hypothetical protein